MPVSYPTTSEPYPEPELGLEYGMQTWTIETPAGVIKAERGEHSWNYAGAPEALIAGRIAEPWQLPGHPKCKRKRRFARADIFRYGKRVRLSIDRDYDGITRVWVHSTGAQKAIDEAAKEEAKALDGMPESAEQFRRWMEIGLVPFFTQESVEETRGGYRFQKAAVETFYETVERAASRLIDGRVLFDAEARRREIEAIKGKTAAADAGLQSLLAVAMAGAEDPRVQPESY